VPPEAASLTDVVKPPGYDDAMVTVRENENLVHDWTFAEVRSRANATWLQDLTRCGSTPKAIFP
jgi:nicotinamide phosphoribosyltransferase